MDYDLKDTIVALSTPPGSGAIGVIRLSGEKAIDIVAAVFKGKDLRQQASHTAHFGRIKNETGQLIDEVVVTLFVAPRSYTKENITEVSCHGSSYIQQQLIQLFIAQGARLARAGEFTLRAYLNGQMDLSQAEAVADLIASTSAGAHQLAMNQMRGGISKEISKLRDELIHFASLIELELDFGEEDVTFADRKDLQELIEKIQSMLRRLLDSFQLGNAIKEGIQTVIAGRPNAGKSTLLNALLDEDRAIVSNIAGTTRDTIEEVLNINGVEFRLVDTAGIREARDQIEAIGVEKTFEKISQSSLLVYVFDVVMLRPAEMIEDLKKLAAQKIPLLVIANKMDLNPYTKLEHYLAVDTASEYLDENNFVPVSAINQMNIPYLKEKLFQTAIDKKLGSESTMISSTRHHTALQAAYERLASVTEGLHNGITGDFLAMDIRQVLHHLGEISGEVTPDDLLGNIFGKFCIGK